MKHLLSKGCMFPIVPANYSCVLKAFVSHVYVSSIAIRSLSKPFSRHKNIPLCSWLIWLASLAMVSLWDLSCEVAIECFWTRSSLSIRWRPHSVELNCAANSRRSSRRLAISRRVAARRARRTAHPLVSNSDWSVGSRLNISFARSCRPSIDIDSSEHQTSQVS